MAEQKTQHHLAKLPITVLRGVGARQKERLQKCGIETVQDLLFHLPFRYQDRSKLTPMISLRDRDHVVVEGIIQHTEVSVGKRRSLICTLGDGTGQINCRFFHFHASQQQKLAVGKRMRCYGEVRGHFSALWMIHPEYQLVTAGEPLAGDGSLTPIYSSTEGLQQRSLFKLTEQALQFLDDEAVLDELMPSEYLHYFNNYELKAAIHFLHRPPLDVNVHAFAEGKHPAQRRLIFEELLSQQLAMRDIRRRHQQFVAPQFISENSLEKQFLANLDFKLTGAQERVAKEIAGDLAQTKPMLRMVQGDVGSGKTVVAALALLKAIQSGYQAALMAPTEILAEQHFQTITQWFAPLGIDCVWLSGKTKVKQRRENLACLMEDKPVLAVGTHALFQEQVQFAKLGLVIIDEQHRFGVHQRLALVEKGRVSGLCPHQLVMTATPIPRTLAMTAYADLALSIIDELPPGRKAIKTIAISNGRRHEIVQRIRALCAEGRQVYWVCTLIDESELLQCQAAQTTADQLQIELADLKIGLIHGRMKPPEKESVMLAFKEGEIDLLVATTVIEVGVDVPNASLMVIENPERLGFAQLHQLRGRVGRGSAKSFCVLLYQPPLSWHAKKRIQIIRETCDGFVIAEHDMKARGPGEILGARQTGIVNFKIADLARDGDLLPQVRECATMMSRDYPEKIPALIARWLQNKEVYADA